MPSISSTVRFRLGNQNCRTVSEAVNRDGVSSGATVAALDAMDFITWQGDPYATVPGFFDYGQRIEIDRSSFAGPKSLPPATSIPEH